ncbi:MAG: isopentenyl-diphosphate Delta-isomerase [Propionibacteriaceae bacterium]|nr:isopentenyl-diphosphate Delta-isomerase [Propionibacteriaceae bacterium]
MSNVEPPRRQAPTGEPGDKVVLLSADGAAIGTADRLQVHTEDTPLHLAFSTYLFNTRGEVLITRRALTKKTWPGVWTNSCCGHPRPGEDIEDAARRRIHEELGLRVGPLTPLLPDFRYRAVDASGIVENEICPVFGAVVLDDEVQPDPAEVAEHVWLSWPDVQTAVAATPQVYSPWSALQIPQITTLPFPPGSTSLLELSSTLRDVNAVLAARSAALEQQWHHHILDAGLDVLPMDLPAWMADLLLAGGKRLRVMMAHWGFVAAGGVPGTPGHQHMVQAAAALELLHLFALIHDDVMDRSDSRRGRPSAHAEAATWHTQAGARGIAEVFGLSLAVLLGDLAHTLADQIIGELPVVFRNLWHDLSVELIAGQRADLTGSAAGRRDRRHAEQVARTKSGRYTITRPLQLGATAAGAPERTLSTLTTFGDHLGQAFALRDDQLGVWGDPGITGKPAGDDILEAKPTVLLSLAHDRLLGAEADLLARVGTPGFGPAEATRLAAMMREAGVEHEVERLISDEVAQALQALNPAVLTPAGIAGLSDAAHTIAWRSA